MTRQVKEMRHVYRDFLEEASQSHPEITVLEADLSSSMATNKLAEKLGKRYVNLGIMEAEMVCLAAGLSVKGYRPYLHTFGPFASRRVFDQLFISLAYAQLDATIIGSDAGVSAEMNGGTHMPFEELGLIRLIPKSTVFEVSDDIQFQAILEETLEVDGLKYIRTIRKTPKPIYQGGEDFSAGYRILKEGKHLTILSSGIMVSSALEAAEHLLKEGYSVQVIDLFRVKPLPEDLAEQLRGKKILTVENHNQIGGIGSAICELLSAEKDTVVKRMGIKESFGQVGKNDYLLDTYHLSLKDIVREAKDLCQL
ncbi:transketolase family protein [Streptococcus catagoni]|uniref:transketolase family protein n=1 Tax=Streptococcus catagoni TaxID=2654874 RepID=UPI00140A9050|nr:transketolase C-terminal domain-containing protein [Streptococcus catagoni]